jgi:hypothetical protein
MLTQAARERQKSAFQTTLVAIALTPTDDSVLVERIGCGDSAFLAFSPQGELLSWWPSAASTNPNDSGGDEESKTLSFGPGGRLLVKILGTASEHPKLLEAAQIHARHASNWLVCTPLDGFGDAASSPQSSLAWHVSKDEPLLVPSYLIGSFSGAANERYRVVNFSSTIRRPKFVPEPRLFEDKGSVTAVLPDHVQSGVQNHVRDEFPVDTQFVLASDGFYGSFDSSKELWAWLVTNQEELGVADRRADVMRNLHARLHAKSSDDDISFVWVRPAGSVELSADGTMEEDAVERSANVD